MSLDVGIMPQSTWFCTLFCSFSSLSSFCYRSVKDLSQNCHEAVRFDLDNVRHHNGSYFEAEQNIVFRSVVTKRGADSLCKRRQTLTDTLIEKMNPKNFAKAGLVAALVAAVNASFAGPDNMVVAVQQLPVIVEPQGINNNALDRVAYSIYETLIRADLKTGELFPGLAESWKRISPETVEFKLRKGVKFHDGTDFTADDVVFTFGEERFMAKDAPGRAAAVEFLGGLKSVEKIDDYTVRVTMQQADPLIERRFAARMSEIISKDGWMKAGGWDNWIKNPIGTGPYRITSFKVGNRLALERFDGYWGDKAPAAKLTFVEVPELSSRVAGLRSGEFDLITEVPPDQIKPLSKDGKIDVVGGAIDNIYALVFDAKSNPVMANTQLRQAILHAIDRDLLVQALFAGKTTPANSFQSKTFGDMYLPEFETKLYDPQKARDLIKASGYKGEQIVWRIQPSYYTLEMTVSQAVASMLKQVGLNVRIDVKENWTQVEAAGKDRMINNASFSAYFPDPASQLWRRMKPGSFWEAEGYFPASDEYKRICELGKELDSSVDPARRKAAWGEMLKQFNANPYACPLYALPMIYAKQKNVVWEPGTQGSLDLSAHNLSFK